MNNRGVGVQVPVGLRIFTSHVAQTGSGVHPASYPLDASGSSPGGKADHSPPAIAEVKKILWRKRPMREVITFRKFKERNCATVAERYRVLPPHPSFRVLLGYAVITWSRNHNVSSVTSRATIHVAFSACQITAFIGETRLCRGSSSSSMRSRSTTSSMSMSSRVVSRPVRYE
jgi:hypothetical protein